MIVSALTPDQRSHLGYPPVPQGSPRAPQPAEGVTGWDVFREKIRAAALAGRLQLLPYLDYHTRETPEIREVYRQMPKSAVVKAALYGKVFAVASLDLQIQPADDTERDNWIAEFCRKAILKCRGGLRKIAETILLPGLLDGHSVSEPKLAVCERGKYRGLNVYERLKGKDTDGGPAVKLITDEFLNVVGVKAFGFGQSEVWDPSGYVIFSNLSLFENPAGQSDMRAVYQPYWMLDTVKKLRIIHLEKYTSPLLKGTYAPGDYEGKASVERAMQQAKGGTWFSVPEDVQVEAMQIAVRGTADFDKAESDYKEEIALAIAGAYLQMLTTEGRSLRGSAGVHKTTAELFVWYLAECLAEVITYQMIPPLIDLNFAPGTDYPTATIAGINDQDLKASADLDDVLVNRLGLPLSKKDRMRYYGRQPASDPSDELKKQQPPPNPFGGGGQGPFDQGQGDSQSFSEPHGGEFAKGGGRVPGKGGKGGGRDRAVAHATPKEASERLAALPSPDREGGSAYAVSPLRHDPHQPFSSEDVEDALAAGEARPELVRLDLLRTSQPEVHRAGVEKYLANPLARSTEVEPDDPHADQIVVVKAGGKSYLYDGNHRATAALLLGWQNVPAHVVRLKPATPQSFADRKGGQFAPGGGRVEGKGETGSSSPRGTKPGTAVPHRAGKETALTSRLRDPARRRRALAGLKREAELAKAIGGVQLPDSEPADVVYAEDATGKRAETHQHVKDILANREVAVKTLADKDAHPERRADAERALSAPLHLFEVKTLLTAKGHAVHMSAKARARKERWQQRYGAGFSVVGVDDRKGPKHSGHRVHVAPGELAGTHHLKHMQKADDMGHVLELVKGVR